MASGTPDPNRHDPERPEGDPPDRETDSSFSRGSSGRRRSSGPPLGPILGGVLALVVLVALGWGIWSWYGGDGRRGGSDRADRLGPAETPTAEVATPAAPSTESEEPLPELEASDAFVRDLVRGLSARPDWAAWLITDNLIERFVATVTAIAAGAAPAEHLDFLEHEVAFAVRDSANATWIDPASYRRWDPLTATFASLDTGGSIRLYERIYPLLEEAYGELGFTADTFHAVLLRAIDRWLEVPVPESPVRVVPDGGLWDYADPELQERRAADHQLLRMGPANVRRVQGKLAEFREALKAR